MNPRTMLSLFLLSVLFAVSLSAADLADKKGLTLEVAKEVAAAAAAFAEKNGWNVDVAILDESGRLKYFEAGDKPMPASVELSIQKAQNAYHYRRPSLEMFEGAVKTPVRGVLPHGIPFNGGYPLMADGQLVGAIGVSGLTAEQDGQVSKAGADSLAGILSR